MARCFAVANQKGGVGKSTTAVNLSTAFAAADKEVLLIDLDPQGNASTGLGITLGSDELGIYQCIIGLANIEDCIRRTFISRLDIIASNVDLSACDIELASAADRESILKKEIKRVRSRYDFIIIDCPPSLGLLTINAFTACDALIIPMQCEFYAIEGLSRLLRTISLIQRNLNKKLEIDGILLTMYDKRNKITQQIEKDVRSYLGDKVYETVIPRNIRVSEAPSHGKPVVIYDINCIGARNYIELANEIFRRMSEKAGLLN